MTGLKRKLKRSPSCWGQAQQFFVVNPVVQIQVFMKPKE
jgi:hypothetical protein